SHSVNIPVGNNGSISLHITHPSDTLERTRNHILVYLPPGPIISLNPGGVIPTYSNHNAPQRYEIIPQILARITFSTVVTINYRLGTLPANPDSPTDLAVHKHKYPTPVHDTLAGFDWIQDTLSPERVAVVGMSIGGSLALMLSLTEAKSIHAVAALEPVCDWTSLDEHCIQSPPTAEETASLMSHSKKGSKKRKFAQWDLLPLLQARKALFSTPERYFDAFASPILFLRSPGKDVPRSFPEYRMGPQYPIPVLKAGGVPEGEECIDYWDVYSQEDLESMHESNTTGIQTKPDPPRRRKALSRWPPFGLDYGISGPTWHHPGQGIKRLEMQLPWVKLFTRIEDYGIPPWTMRGTGRHKGLKDASVLAQQGHEMVNVMRRACFWGREKGYAGTRVTL
ncbi:uncharacterized protein BO80DRAFT_329715, partial [Aspergillus ibericus CBS 121593]